jgi:DNA-binding NtrC family response regulator
MVGDSKEEVENIGLLLKWGIFSHGDGTRVNILVIDDEESIRFSFSRFLASARHKVITAKGYREALARMDETEFKLILADIILDDGWGIDILQEVMRRNLKTRVIIMTAYPSTKTDQDSFRLHTVGYLVKPIKQAELLHSVSKAWSAH